MCMCHCKGKVVNDLPILGLLGDKSLVVAMCAPTKASPPFRLCGSERSTNPYGEMSEGHDHI